MEKVRFLGEACDIEFKTYPNGRTAIQLWCEEGPMGTATVNIPEYPVPENHVLIKDWSENRGMLQALIDAGVVKDTGIVVPSGYVEANLAELLVQPQEV